MLRPVARRRSMQPLTRGPSEFLFMPQVHYEISKHMKAQFGMGMRDDVEDRHGELGFRIIFER